MTVEKGAASAACLDSSCCAGGRAQIDHLRMRLCLSEAKSSAASSWRCQSTSSSRCTPEGHWCSRRVPVSPLMGGLLGTKARRRYLVLVLIAFAVAWSTGSLPWSKREAQPVLSAQSAAPIHVLFTASGSYTIGLTALINSTISNASPATRRRLLFHLVAQTHAGVERVLETVHTNLKLAELRTAGYALDDLQDPRLDDVKVWADYRSASLSEVREALPRAPEQITDPGALQPIVYARYLVPSILPTSVDRAIYLDQDTLVQRDIADLWEIDLEDFPLAAARS